MKVITIHSDGSPSGTHIIDEDGNEMQNVIEATVYLDAREVPKATLTILPINLNVKVRLQDCSFICPACSEYIEHECEPK